MGLVWLAQEVGGVVQRESRREWGLRTWLFQALGMCCDAVCAHWIWGYRCGCCV